MHSPLGVGECCAHRHPTSPEPCEYSLSPWFGTSNVVPKAQLSHNLKLAGTKNLDFGGEFATCSEVM